MLDNHDEFDAGLLRLADEAKRLLAPETELIKGMGAQALINRQIVNVLMGPAHTINQTNVIAVSALLPAYVHRAVGGEPTASGQNQNSGIRGA